MITGPQSSAARALLGWTLADLARESGLAAATLTDFENAKRPSSSETIQKIISAFERAGIMFTDGEGVRKRTYEVRVLRGQEGFWSFYDDIYETIKSKGGKILVSNVDEKVFWKWLGDKRTPHKARMEKLTNFEQKIIVKEGTSELLTAYDTTAYRLLPAHQFAETPFYLYGDKLAIINFEERDVQIFIIDQPNIAAAYEKTFFALWDICRPVEKKKEK